MINRFLKGRPYRHMSTLDVDMYAASHFYEGTDYVTGKFLYVNRKSGFLHHPTPERVRIKKADLWKWSRA